MKHLKLYEEFNNKLPTTHPGFVKTEEEAIVFLEANNINTKYCKIIESEEGIIVRINYSDWVTDDYNNLAEYEFEEYVERRVDNQTETSRFQERVREEAIDRIDRSDIEYDVDQEYPELKKPNRSDYYDINDYYEAMENWDESEYDGKVEELMDRTIDEISDYIWDEIVSELRSEIEDELDSWVSDRLSDMWNYNEEHRAEILIKDYSPNPVGFLPVDIQFINGGQYNSNDILIRPDITIFDLISTKGLLNYEGYSDYNINSKYLATAGDLNGEYVNKIKNAPILTKNGLPGNNNIEPDYIVDYVLCYNEHFVEEDIIEKFIELMFSIDQNIAESVLNEVEAKEPEIYQKLVATGKVANIKTNSDRLTKADKYKGVIKF